MSNSKWMQYAASCWPNYIHRVWVHVDAVRKYTGATSVRTRLSQTVHFWKQPCSRGTLLQVGPAMIQWNMWHFKNAIKTLKYQWKRNVVWESGGLLVFNHLNIYIFISDFLCNIFKLICPKRFITIVLPSYLDFWCFHCFSQSFKLRISVILTCSVDGVQWECSKKTFVILLEKVKHKPQPWRQTSPLT